MEMVYNNFDGLDITFQGALPELILTQLKNAKEQAQDENRDKRLDSALFKGTPHKIEKAKDKYQFLT